MSKTFPFEDEEDALRHLSQRLKSKVARTRAGLLSMGEDKEKDMEWFKKQLVDSAHVELMRSVTTFNIIRKETDDWITCDACSDVIVAFCPSKECHDNSHKDCEAEKNLLHTFPRFCPKCYKLAMCRSFETWWRMAASFSRLPKGYLPSNKPGKMKRKGQPPVAGKKKVLKKAKKTKTKSPARAKKAKSK